MNNKWKIWNRRFISFSFYCILLNFLMCFAGDAAGSIVSEIEIKGLYSIGKDELLYLLDIDRGKTINEESVRSGIKRAFLKGIFEDLSIETTGEEEVKVSIHVKERNVVNKIYINGDHPFSGKTMKELFPLKENQAMICDILNQAEKELKKELSLRGFPVAHVKTEIEKLKKPHRINIHLQIHSGKPVRIKKINISGTQEDIKAIIQLSEGDVYDQTILIEDLDRIKRHFKKKEYFRPVVGPYSFTDGVLNISVNSGKRLKISIEGNHKVSSRTLMKEMPFFVFEDFSDDLAEEAVHRMLSVYHIKGHPFAQVAPVITSKNDLILLNFFIFEGPGVKIQTISFTGTSLEEKRLKEIMSLKEGKAYNPDLIDADGNTLKAFYNALGYLNAVIEEFQTEYDEESNTIDILIRVNEGLKTEIENVIITGTKHTTEADVRKAVNIKPGDTYNEVDISDARFRVIELYNSRGFPDAKVTVMRDFHNNKASVTFQIEEGDEIHLGKTIIKGNYQTKYGAIKRELKHEECMHFNYSLLMEDRRKLYRLGLFTDIDIELLDRYDNKKDVLMKIQEGKAGAVELSFGYAEYERFRGILDVSYRNLWGMNRQASVRFELSSLERRFILQYYEPWFLNRPLPFRAFYLHEDKKEINIDTRETRYRIKRDTATAGIEKSLTDKLMSEVYYEFSVVKTFDVKPDVILTKDDTGTLIISGLRSGIIYDTRDHPFYPRKGILSGVSAKITAPVFLSETDFLKVMFYFNTYYEITRGIVLAASMRGGVAQGFFDTRDLPIVERFFLGGRTTVRGYEQDSLGPKGVDGTPTGGNAFFMENLEVRTSLGRGIGLVAFLDGGNAWLDLKDINPADFRFTTGLGLRYNTPVGPLRIDYGHKLQREKDESKGELHFSIGHAF
ncbi:MAG: outer membrane protein assembly factor BamA [Nitrospirae bacterium]|nr:outer membrane protein assembly factor BamA [Nitrospirota bacterium]